ncbi:MAG: RNA-binding protein [Methyloprofundus sp.]|nr:RNA-binding protein [Methyloprofundus sp.]
MQVIISNLPPETTKDMLLEEIQERHIQIVDLTLETSGNPDNITAIVKLDTGHAGAAALEKRVHGKYWHGRVLTAYAMRAFTGEGDNE